MQFVDDFLSWDKDTQKNTLTSLISQLRNLYDFGTEIVQDDYHSRITWASKCSSKDEEEKINLDKEYKNTKNTITNKFIKFKDSLSDLLKYLDPQDEEEVRLRKKLLGTRTQKGLIE